MDINLIEKLMKDMDASSLTKLSIEYEGFKISMEKGGAAVAASSPCTVQVSQNESEESRAVSNENQAEQLQEEKEHHSYITSPMVGTFYEAAGPDQEPFVKVGDYVKAGQTICIIESMKLMNEIEADVEGEVTAILVSDANMVEYGQKMFEICPR